MTVTRKCRIWAVVPVEDCPDLVARLDRRRVRHTVVGGLYHATVGFQCPQDMSVQEALVLMHDACPLGTEVYAS